MFPKLTPIKSLRQQILGNLWIVVFCSLDQTLYTVYFCSQFTLKLVLHLMRTVQTALDLFQYQWND